MTGEGTDWPEEERLVCRGKEFAGRGQIDRTWSALHVPGLFITESPPAPAAMSMQEFIDWTADPAHSYVADGYGGLSVIGHPFLCRTAEWAGCRRAHLNLPTIGALHGFDALEVAHHHACGFADRLWDELCRVRLRQGEKLIWGFGADDTHFGHSGKLGLSWTATKVRRVNTWELKRSMREGAVYTTNGLRGLDIRVEPDRVVVTSEEPVEVRWLKAGQYYDDFGMEGFTRHGFRLTEPIPREWSCTIVDPIISSARGPNRCLKTQRGVRESVYRLSVDDETHSPAAGYIRCVVFRPEDLVQFAEALRSGEVFKPGVNQRERPIIEKAFFMPIRIGPDGLETTQYPEQGTWLTGVTHNHADLLPSELDRAYEYAEAYEAAGHRASFETGYTLAANPYLHVPPGVTPRVRQVAPRSCRPGTATELEVWVENGHPGATVFIGGRMADVISRDGAGGSLRVRLPADLPVGIYDVTVRHVDTPYQHTLSEAFAVQNQDAVNDGWRAFDMADGLPDLHVYCVRAIQGRIWAGTNWGLAWLEGERWRADQSGPVAVEAVAGDSAGALWACGYDGVYRREPGGGWRRFTEQDGLLKPKPMCDVLCASDGSVYVTCHAPSFVARYDGAAWQSHRFPGRESRWHVTNLLETPEGEIWAGSFTHTAWRRAADGWEELGLPDLSGLQPRRLYRSPHGTVVAATASSEEWPVGGVCVLEDGQWTPINQEQGLPHHRVWDIAFEPDDTIWAATSFGVARIRPDREVDVFTCLNSGLPCNRTNSVCVHDGMLWTGTEWGIASVPVAALA